MTMPDERTRALRGAGEFLRKVQLGEGFSLEAKREVQYILRHYPADHEIKLQARLDAARAKKVGEPWLGPEEN
ncbi:MAG: BPSL0761 family protein [Burkholderiaceae bacterium]|nr:BPSL0761 family protein [Burkholderiaceae bacterium]